MNGVLGDMLSQRAEAVDIPDLDVEALVTRGERRVRRRRVGAVAATVLAVVMITAGPFALRDDKAAQPPAREPSAPPSIVGEGEASSSRPLTYGDGSGRVIYYGGRSVQVPRSWLKALDLTDDGVMVHTVDRRVWFTDGSSVRELGRSSGDWAIDEVMSGNAGSVAAWFERSASQGNDLIVYDTRELRVVTRLNLGGRVRTDLDGVVGDRVYWHDSTSKSDRVVRNMVLDVSDGTQAPTSTAGYLADVRSSGRSLVSGDSLESGKVSDGTGAEFRTMGSRLVPVEVPVKEGAGTPTTMYDATTGARVNLRAPRGFDANATLFQWLDDDRVALMDWEHERHRMLVCRVSSGSCQMVHRPDGLVWPVLPDVLTPPGEG